MLGAGFGFLVIVLVIVLVVDFIGVENLVSILSKLFKVIEEKVL